MNESIIQELQSSFKHQGRIYAVIESVFYLVGVFADIVSIYHIRIKSLIESLFVEVFFHQKFSWSCAVNAGVMFNPRPDWRGGGGQRAPWWFFVNNSNSAGNRALKFSVPLRASIIRIL